MSWIYLEYTDDMGHRYGKSPQLDTAISMLDKQIGSIMKQYILEKINLTKSGL